MNKVILGITVIASIIIQTFLINSNVYAATAPYTVKEEAIFNNPVGTDQEQYVIFQKIIDAIDNTPSGETIRLTTYSYNSPKITEHLKSAYARGVVIKLLTDDHLKSPELDDLTKTLGTDTAKNSFVKICKGSCMSSEALSMMHAKFFLFSKTGASHHVSMTGSTNLTTVSATEAWNNLHTIVGNIPIYNSYVTYFNDMLPDTDRLDYDQSFANGPYKVYFYPQQEKKGEVNNTVYQILSNVSCSGAAKGYGTKGKTNVRVVMYQWTNAQKILAEKLWSMDNAGCDVKVLVGTKGGIEQGVLDALLKKGGKYGGVEVSRSNFEKDGKTIYVHSKYFTINGNYLGNKKSKIVFTGSLNFQLSPQRNSNENMLKITSPSIYDQYLKNFYLIRDHYSERAPFNTTAPVNTPSEL